MQVYHGIQDLKNRCPQAVGPSVVTIGNFDGVHLGHRQLIQAVVSESQALRLPSFVYTFHPHPVRVLYPQRETRRLFDLRDQQEQLASLGVENILIENFTPEFSRITADVFLNEYIWEPLQPKTLVVGYDFSFGANRDGGLPFLQSFCAQKKIKLVVIPPFELEGKVVSSSKIRDELKLGDVSRAEQLLGRQYYLRGEIEQGFQRGRSIGVPTANIHPDVEFTPRKGVYVTLTKLQDRFFPSVTNIGTNPTFHDAKEEKVKVETHLLDFDSQIYGLEAQVFLLAFLRDEKKFSSVNELKEQIHQDIHSTRKYFVEHPQY